MATDDELLSHEIECHQFTVPLEPPARPPRLLRRAVARLSGKVWWRVGWTCSCMVAVLESAEKEMLLRGELQDHLDIFQLQGGAAASAGTHSKPGAADIGQTSDAQIETLRRNGGDFQRRTPAQGFILHCHGFAQGCPHGSPALMAQKRAWNRGRNGLVSNGPIEGLWPTQNWQTAVAERAKVIVSLIQDIAKAVWAYDGIDNSKQQFSGNKANEDVPAGFALAVLGSRTKDLSAKIWNDSVVTLGGVTPATKWSGGHIIDWLRRTLGTTVTKDDLAATNAKIDALAAAVAALTPQGPQS